MKSSTRITPDVFENLLYLSRLSAQDSDSGDIAVQVEKIVSYFDVLKKFDTQDSSVFCQHVDPAALRADRVVTGIEQTDLKKMTDEYMDGYFRVPKVLGSGA